MYYIYVLQSETTGKLYVGSSEDPERRLHEHNSGKTISTKPFLPYRIIYREGFVSRTAAIQREHQIKRSGKLRKEIREGNYKAPSSIG